MRRAACTRLDINVSASRRAITVTVWEPRLRDELALGEYFPSRLGVDQTRRPSDCLPIENCWRVWKFLFGIPRETYIGNVVEIFLSLIVNSIFLFFSIYFIVYYVLCIIIQVEMIQFCKTKGYKIYTRQNEIFSAKLSNSRIYDTNFKFSFLCQYVPESFNFHGLFHARSFRSDTRFGAHEGPSRDAMFEGMAAGNCEVRA